jgi:elongator complex protein 3
MVRRSAWGRTARARRSTWVLGTELVEKAKEMAREAGYGRIAVISAIGTRAYYAKHGFELSGLYMTADL